MTAIRQRQKQRLLVAMCCGIASALMLPAGLVIAYNSVLNSNSGTNVNDIKVLKILETPVALLATVNDSNEITTVSVIALAGGSLGGTIISVPAKAKAEVADGEPPRRIFDSYINGDPTAFVSDVEGLLDVSISAVGIFNRGDLLRLLGKVGPAEVLLDSDVRNTTPDGATLTVAKTGKATLDTLSLISILLAREIDQSEAARFNHQKSVWTAITNAVGLGLRLDATNINLFETPLDFDGFMQRLFAGPIQYWQFSATKVPVGVDNPNSLDMFSLDPSEVTMIMASVAPTSITGSGVSGALSVQVDSPFNDPVISREVVRRLVAIGFDVALVREVPGPPSDLTQLRFVNSSVFSELDLKDFIGDFDASRTSERAQGIDLQIILGSSFVKFSKDKPDLPTTTVVPPEQ
jgi:hypothetical protein